MLSLSIVKTSPPVEGFHAHPESARRHRPGCFDRSRKMFSKFSLFRVSSWILLHRKKFTDILIIYFLQYIRYPMRSGKGRYKFYTSRRSWVARATIDRHAAWRDRINFTRLSTYIPCQVILGSGDWLRTLEWIRPQGLSLRRHGVVESLSFLERHTS